MTERFVGEPITPLGDFDARAMSRGEPGLPSGFLRGGSEVSIKRVIRAHKGYGRDQTHGSSERYLHKHWFELAMSSGEIWRIYYDRSSHDQRSWRLFSVRSG